MTIKNNTKATQPHFHLFLRVLCTFAAEVI